MICLNDQQQKALNVLQEVLPTHRSMSIKGPAGSGKSYLTRAICDYVEQQGRQLVLVSPTHKAAAVLAKASGRPACTIHKALGLVPSVDYQTGQDKPKRRKGAERPPMGTVLLVDEASMVGAMLYEELQHYQCIFIGDEYQLAPVGETLSPALQCAPVCVLNQVMRHSGAILELATTIRHSLTTREALPTFRTNREVLVQPRRDFDESYFEAIEAACEDVTYAAWTNAACTAMIRRVRKVVFGKDPIIPDVGDLLISNTAVMDTSVPDGEMILANNQEVRVIGVTVGGMTVDGIHIDGYKAQYVDEDEAESSIQVSTDHAALSRLKAKYRKSAMRVKSPQAWSDYFDVCNTFADLRFPHATTVHKTQGSSWGTVFVDVPDILRNTADSATDGQEFKRLLYVATTRAEKRLHLKR